MNFHTQFVCDRMSSLRVKTLESSKAILERYWKPRPREIRVPLNQALGSALAKDTVAKIDVPPFDRSAVDGYAVRSSDTFGAGEDSPIRLTCIGGLRAGRWPRTSLRAGQCMEIDTGAPMPKGADSVVAAEYATTDGRYVCIQRAVAPGENVATRGSDIRRGDRIARRGEVVTVADIGAFAAVGIDRVEVYARPRVAIISSGAELVKLGQRCGRGKIYDVNGPALCEAVRACGAEPVYLGIARDESRSIAKLIRKGLLTCDVVLFSGGTSAGAGDIAPKVVDRLGKPGVLVHGLAMKPGKPTFIALVRRKPIFGLPGYPVSALMVFDQLVAPYLRRLGGLPPIKPAKVRARLKSKILSARGRRELVPVKLTRGKEGLLAEPIFKDSGAITSLSLADGYIDVPLEREIIGEGEEVEVTLFRGEIHAQGSGSNWV